VSWVDRVRVRTGAAPGWLPPLVTMALLALTALVPYLPVLRPTGLAGLSVGALWLCLTGTASALRRRQRRGRTERPSGKRASGAVQLALYLSPVVLLSLVFPVATRRMAGAEVGGTSLTAPLLASAVTVPWMSQAVCLPLYRALGPLTAGGERDEIDRRFLQVWPAVLAKSAPLVLVFAVAVEGAHRWSAEAIATYLALCLLHVLFTQSLVPGNARTDRMLWAAAWTAYAAAVLVLPTHWYLPPLLGTATQLVPMLRRRRVRAIRFETVPVAADLAAGLLLGSVLWVDKFVLFLRASDAFGVQAVFLALLPAVLAYNYYFVRLAPGLNLRVGALRTAMQTQPYARLARRSHSLSLGVSVAVHRTALVGASLALAATVAVTWANPASAGVVAAVSVASWLFMLVTILSYKLDYIGRTRQALAAGAAHLVLAVTVLSLVAPVAPAYTWLFLLDLPVLAFVWRSCLRQWRSAEYAFFWRHATAW
jgi:hypothetical protein